MGAQQFNNNTHNNKNHKIGPPHIMFGITTTNPLTILFQASVGDCGSSCAPKAGFWWWGIPLTEVVRILLMAGEHYNSRCMGIGIIYNVLGHVHHGRYLAQASAHERLWTDSYYCPEGEVWFVQRFTDAIVGYPGQCAKRLVLRIYARKVPLPKLVVHVVSTWVLPVPDYNVQNDLPSRISLTCCGLGRSTHVRRLQSRSDCQAVQSTPATAPAPPAQLAGQSGPPSHSARGHPGVHLHLPTFPVPTAK